MSLGKLEFHSSNIHAHVKVIGYRGSTDRGLIVVQMLTQYPGNCKPDISEVESIQGQGIRNLLQYCQQYWQLTGWAAAAREATRRLESNPSERACPKTAGKEPPGLLGTSPAAVAAASAAARLSLSG